MQILITTVAVWHLKSQPCFFPIFCLWYLGDGALSNPHIFLFTKNDIPFGEEYIWGITSIRFIFLIFLENNFHSHVWRLFLYPFHS